MVNITYCSDKEMFSELLKRHNIYTSLRIPNTIRKYVNNIILTEQLVNKRGILKFISICYEGDKVTRQELLEAVPALGETQFYTDTTNRHTSICIFYNNLTALLRQTEGIMKLLEDYNLVEDPRINISTDLADIKGTHYICHDIAAYLNIIQFTSISEQKGDIILGLNDLSEEFVSAILLSCINTAGRIKVFLKCEDFDKDLWKLRSIESLQKLYVNIDFSILDAIISTV